MGTRSMATYIETPDIKILLDAGVALGFRHGLLPHPEEYGALQDARKRIREYASKAELITISHYHFDHYTATWNTIETEWTWSNKEEATEIYRGKTVFAKDFKNSINPSQRKRGYIFDKITANFISDKRVSDSSTFEKAGTSITFSEPHPHGEEGSALGFVIITMIEHGEDRLLYCPDVQGPASKPTLEKILSISPNILIIGGPPLYLLKFKVDELTIRNGLEHLSALAGQIRYVIVDHHLLRSEEGLAELDRIKREHSKDGRKIVTFAEHMGLKNTLLEAKRRRLYEESPPPPDFLKWTKLPLHLRRAQLPPL